MNPSDDLQRHFAALRKEDADNVPSFARTMASARARREPRRRDRWLRAALVGAVAAIAIVVVAIDLAGPRVSTPGGALPAAGTVDQWVAPTDALLASAELPAVSNAVLGSAADRASDDIAFFSSPTADLLDFVDDPTVRTP